MSSLPSSWETSWVTTVCNASTFAGKYSEVTSAILTEAARRMSFAKDSADEAFVVQGLTGRSNNQRSRSKSRDNRICNYQKKPRHIKADFRALKAKTNKAQTPDLKSSRYEEVNYIGSSAKILTTDPNILSIENTQNTKYTK